MVDSDADNVSTTSDMDNAVVEPNQEAPVASNVLYVETPLEELDYTARESDFIAAFNVLNNGWKITINNRDVFTIHLNRGVFCFSFTDKVPFMLDYYLDVVTAKGVMHSQVLALLGTKPLYLAEQNYLNEIRVKWLEHFLIWYIGDTYNDKSLGVSSGNPSEYIFTGKNTYTCTLNTSTGAVRLVVSD